VLDGKCRKCAKGTLSTDSGGQSWPQPPLRRPEPAESRLRAELPALQDQNDPPPFDDQGLLGRSDPVPDGVRRQGGVGVEPQLFGEFLFVEFHRLDGDTEHLGDFLANASFRQ